MPQINAPTSGYNAQLSAYNVTESTLRRMRAQLGKALTSTSVFRILCLGDSITEGVAGTTPYRSTNWPSKLRDILTADGRAGQVGEGIIMVAGQTQANYDPRWTIGTGWARTGAFYSNVLTSNSANAGTNTALSLALPTCDTIKFVYMQHNAVGGTYTYQVDGGAAVTVNSTGTPSFQTITISGLSLATHTLTINPPTAGYAYVGPVIYSTAASPKDVEVITGGGHNGIKAGDMAFNIGNPSGAGVAELHAALAPDLTCFLLGRNDMAAASGRTPTQYKADMGALLDVPRNAGRDALIIAPPPASQVTYSQEPAMRAALYQLADEKDVALLDLSNRFGPNWNAAPYNLSSDNIHPLDAGSYAIAQCVANLLLNA